MKLVFYSGGHDYENIQLDNRLIELVGTDSPQVVYIPSCSYLSDSDFQEFVKQYERFKIFNIIHFPIDQPYTEVLKNEVFKSDIIHLSGGNTYYFLKHLRKAKMLGELKKFLKNGGVLTGLSAGGIIMTKTIGLAGIPDFDRDENDENLKNLDGMNLVDFEFFPHYKNSKRYDDQLLAYSRKLNIPIYACPDGSGVVVVNDNISFVGKAYCFLRGKKSSIK